MKTVSANPTLAESLSDLAHAHPVAAISCGLAVLFIACLDRNTRRAFLPF